jgi:hypothetical protein
VRSRLLTKIIKYSVLLVKGDRKASFKKNIQRDEKQAPQGKQHSRPPTKIAEGSYKV